MISRRWVPLCLCLLHFGALLLPARSHPFGNYATETDFYHYYAPDAARLMAGDFPENPYQGPGYPAALALLARITGQDLFVVGKWLSVICAVGAGLWLAVLFGRLLGWGGGIGAQLLFIVSGEIPQFSINAATDLFFLAICLAALVVLPGAGRLRREGTARVVLAGALSGAAYLTRYNGLFLILTCIAALLWIDPIAPRLRRRLASIALYLASCLLVATPWFIANTVHRGSPLYNTNYLNLATQFYPELVAGKTNQDGTRALAERFGSFREVLAYDPGRVAQVYPGTLGQSLWYSLTGGLVHPLTGGLAWVGIALFLWRRREAQGMVLLCGAGLYLLLMALNHWETRYYFFVGAIYSGMAVLAIQAGGEWLAARGVAGRWRAGRLLPLAVFGLVWVLSLAQSSTDLRKFLAAQPWEVERARAYLRGVHPAGTRLRIVSRKPHLPYLLDSEWVFFPPVKSLGELEDWVARNRIDYLVIGRRELKERRELAPLARPEQAPPWLSPAWIDPETRLVLYRVGPPAAGAGRYSPAISSR
jgi:hypothetical protein